MEQQNDNKPTIILVIGAASFLCCGLGWILGPIAWMMGNNYQKECILEGVEPAPNANIGKILGIIGTLFGVLVLLLTCTSVVLQVLLPILL